MEGSGGERGGREETIDRVGIWVVSFVKDCWKGGIRVDTWLVWRSDIMQCLNGASVEYVQDEDAQIEKENLKLKQRIEELKKEIDQSQKSVQNVRDL